MPSVLNLKDTVCEEKQEESDLLFFKEKDSGFSVKAEKAARLAAKN